MDKSFQDVQLYLNYKCTGECKSGVLLRAKKAADGSMTGVFVSLASDDTGYYSVTLDASGKETSRDQLTAPGRGGGAGAAASAPRWRGGGARARGRQPCSRRRTGSRTASGTRDAGRQRRTRTPDVEGGRVERGGHHDWPGRARLRVVRPVPLVPNQVLSTFGPAARAALDEKNASGFGAIALYVGGSGEVRYKDLAWKDLMRVVTSRGDGLVRATRSAV